MKLIMENWRGYVNEQPEEPEEPSKLETVGDLRRAVAKAIGSKRMGQGTEAVKDVVVGAIADLVPGLHTAKSLFDVAKSLYSLPDDKKSNSPLDILNVDDQVSAIVDDTIENAFLKTVEKQIEGLPDDAPLADLDMTKQLSRYIASTHSDRTVTAPEEG